MEILIGLVVGILIGMLLLVFAVKAKNVLVKKHEQDIQQLNQTLLQLRTEKSVIEVENAKIVAESNSKMQSFAEKVEELQQLKEQQLKASVDRETLIKIISSLKADNEAKEKMLEDKDAEIEKRLKQQAEQFKEQTETLKLQFKQLSEQLLKEKTQELGENNKEHLSPFIERLKEEMKKVGDEIKETREKSVEQNSSLSTVIREMMERTNEIGNEANKLADALKGKSKTQGLYGELILTDILTRSGLVEGEHFETQVMIRDDKGKAVVNEEIGSKMITDVIVHYPDKDLIIDSKVSLKAYLEWYNATTDEERDIAAKKHIASIKSHIKEITTKSYATHHKDSKRETIDCVVMFIPNEGALQLMRKIEPSLWYSAYDQKVIITSELSLFSLLKMIENYWVQVQQQRNQDKIIKAAENMLERVAVLYEMVDDLEDTFKSVEVKLDDVKKKMLTGKQSIATSVRQVIESGVKSAKMEKRLSTDNTIMIEE